MSRDTTLGHRSIRSAITLPSSSSAIPREISSRSVSVNILRWQITRCSSSTVSPTIYTKINCFDRLGSRGPGGRDFAAAVAVAGYRDAGCAGEGDPVMGESPSFVAESTAELCHSESVSACVLGAYPAHQPAPAVVVDCAEHSLGHPIAEVVRPPA